MKQDVAGFFSYPYLDEIEGYIENPSTICYKTNNLTKSAL